MATIRIDYKGDELTYQQPPQMTNMFQVSIASNDMNLMARIGRSSKIVSGKDMEEAIANARRFVDALPMK